MAASALQGFFWNIYEGSFPKPSGWQVHVSAWTKQPRRVSAMVSQEGEGNYCHEMSLAKQIKLLSIFKNNHLNFHEKLETEIGN